MISIVIPVHNEEQLLERTAKGVLEAGSEAWGDIELVLVENGSKDRTWELCQQLATDTRVVVLRETVGDYGNAVKAGLRSAKGDIAVVFDCDLWDITFATGAVSMLQETEHAVVVASKTMQGSHDERGLFRRAGTAVFTAVVKAMCGLQASDTHGMKAIALHKVRAELADCQLAGHVFDTELIVRCERAGFVTAELPCVVREEREARTGYLSRVPSALKDVWKLRQMLASEHRPKN
jgi:glycosyltransferase involved in cell wall biosynthesis